MKMLQLFVFAVFFATMAEAQSALQTICPSLGTRGTYNGTSCYVLRFGSSLRYSQQKNSCQDILGYYGHLAFIRNSVVASVLSALIISYTTSNAQIVVGFEQANNTGARNMTWGFGNIDGSNTPSTYVPWASGYPSATTANTRAFYEPSLGLQDYYGEEAPIYAFICEYDTNFKTLREAKISEEQYAHQVTLLEQMCSATNFTHIFVNNKCYTLHQELKTYPAAKSSCTDIPGFSGYLAQPRNSSDLGILNNLLLIPNGTVWGTIHIGVEYNPAGWFYATATGISFAASYLPWAPSMPILNGSNSVYYLKGFYYSAPNSISRPFICEYGTFSPIYKQYTILEPGSLFMSINTYINVSLAKCLRLCRIDYYCTSSAYSTSMSACQLLAVAGSVSAANFTITADYEIFTVVQ